jgi:hypothetical protein
MATNDSKRTGFRIANGPVISQEQEDASEANFSELSRFSTAPMLFATARDPHTLFIYWNVDWSSAFAAAEPLDRHVYLRVMKEDGAEESESLVEPLLGSYYAPVATPRGVYRVVLGYYQKSGAWNSVASSETITMPADSASENTVVDVATVPFHLSFQKIIDLFCESNGDPLTTVLARVQQRALDEEDLDLGEEEREILRAMDLSVNQLRDAREAFAERADDKALRKRAEAILGFGSTSPAHGFGGSSRG